MLRQSSEPFCVLIREYVPQHFPHEQEQSYAKRNKRTAKPWELSEPSEEGEFSQGSVLIEQAYMIVCEEDFAEAHILLSIEQTSLYYNKFTLASTP